jgi:preprotein translocase subunit SecB
MMATAAINIRDYQITSLKVETRDEFDDTKPVLCQVHVQFIATTVEGSNNQFAVRVKFDFNTEELTLPPNLPYVISIDLRGAFETAMHLYPNAIPAPLAYNALNILYGVARGFIATATGGFGFGPFVAPGVTLESIVEKAAQNPATAVMPVPEMLNAQAPGVPQYFRFLFATQDLPRLADLLEPEIRDEAVEALRVMMETVNRAPTEDSAVADARLRIQDVVAVLNKSQAAVMPIMVDYLRHVSDALSLVDAVKQQQAAAAAPTTENATPTE